MPGTVNQMQDSRRCSLMKQALCKPHLPGVKAGQGSIRRVKTLENRMKGKKK
jgi:hypothetical protein